MKREVIQRLPKEVNDLLLKYFITRIIILLVILGSYSFILRTGLDVKLYVAIITLLIFSFLLTIFLISFIEYILYCIKENEVIGIYKFAIIKTALEIENELTCKHQKIRYFLNKFLFTNTSSLARKAAEEVIFNNHSIRHAINTIILYYILFFSLYIYGYNYIYEKIIGIDFSNFWSPIIWSIHYLWTL